MQATRRSHWFIHRFAHNEILHDLRVEYAGKKQIEVPAAAIGREVFGNPQMSDKRSTKGEFTHCPGGQLLLTNTLWTNGDPSERKHTHRPIHPLLRIKETYMKTKSVSPQTETDIIGTSDPIICVRSESWEDSELVRFAYESGMLADRRFSYCRSKSINLQCSP